MSALFTKYPRFNEDNVGRRKTLQEKSAGTSTAEGCSEAGRQKLRGYFLFVPLSVTIVFFSSDPSSVTMTWRPSAWL